MKTTTTARMVTSISNENPSIATVLRGNPNIQQTSLTTGIDNRKSGYFCDFISAFSVEFSFLFRE